MRNRLLSLAVLFGTYLAAVAGLWAFQRVLVYSPSKVGYVPPSHYPMLAGVEEVALETADGVALRAWYAPAPVGRPTVVMFSGKSSALRTERYRLQHFHDAGMGVFMLAYRGYSGNGGEPSEQGLYADARAALDWLEAQGVPQSSIALYGISLGSGVAMAMAAERKYAAVVLEAPYTSIVDVAARRFPIVPVRWLMKDRFDSMSRIDELEEPLLVMHGDDDFVIPQRFGRELFDAATGPKAGFWPSDVGHKDIFDRGGFDVARSFIEHTIAGIAIRVVEPLSPPA
jgi:fermentation-respiration switch protein FrsA (DUF1100 family)